MKLKGFIHAVIAGHGGVNENGEYQILKKGSKQALVNGRMIYEGEHNRFIRDEVITQSAAMGIKTIDIVPEVVDVPIEERVRRVNANYDIWNKQGFRLVLWELHLNAFDGSAFGTEVFTSRGNNFSDTMATVWHGKKKELVKDYKDRTDMSDGDVDKEADFYVIKNSKAFAVLIEFFFFDHARSVERFCNPDGYHLLAKTVVQAMKEINTRYDPNTLRLL